MKEINKRKTLVKDAVSMHSSKETVRKKKSAVKPGNPSVSDSRFIDINLVTSRISNPGIKRINGRDQSLTTKKKDPLQRPGKTLSPAFEIDKLSLETGTVSFDETDLIGDNHIGTSIETPMRPDAFQRSDKEKIKKIAGHFKEIMYTLGLDLEDDSLKGTPNRVAKMYVQEIFRGLDPAKKPEIALFENKYQYNQMLVEKNITLYSNCEHHFVPIIGKAHVAYISSGKVIGLSKLNRIVQYFAQRPQVQERLTMQISNELKAILGTEDVAVVIDAVHLCVSSRGIRDVNSSTVTAEYSGKFLDKDIKNEFLKYIS
jgi:GTP cyclohydrolase I